MNINEDPDFILLGFNPGGDVFVFYFLQQLNSKSSFQVVYKKKLYKMFSINRDVIWVCGLLRTLQNTQSVSSTFMFKINTKTIKSPRKSFETEEVWTLMGSQFMFYVDHFSHILNHSKAVYFILHGFWFSTLKLCMTSL